MLPARGDQRGRAVRVPPRAPRPRAAPPPARRPRLEPHRPVRDPRAAPARSRGRCSSSRARFGSVLALHHVEVREGGRRRGRVARVGVAVAPQTGVRPPEGFGHPGRGDHRAHRQVAARDALRAREDVGFEAPARAREPVADAPESRDDLVGDEQHAGLAADRADLGQVARRAARTRRRPRSPARRRTPPPARARPTRSHRGARRASPRRPSRHRRPAGRDRPRSPRCRRGSSPRRACRGTRARA